MAEKILLIMILITNKDLQFHRLINRYDNPLFMKGQAVAGIAAFIMYHPWQGLQQKSKTDPLADNCGIFKDLLFLLVKKRHPFDDHINDLPGNLLTFYRTPVKMPFIIMEID